MSYSSADVAASDRALAALDYPLLGAPAIFSATAAEWRTGGSFGTGSDATAADSPGSRAYDGLASVATKPASAAVTWYYMLNLSGSPITFDGVAIIGHNFGTIGSLTITLQIANDSTFSTNLLDVASWTPGSSNDRLVDLTLGSGNAKRYTSVPYVRLKITGTSGTPQFTELALFKRTQLQRKPRRPYNPSRTAQRTSVVRTDAGEVTTYVSSRGARHLLASVDVTGSTKIGEVVTWWSDARQGTRGFIWCENPNSTPAQTYLLAFQRDDQEFEFDEVGLNRRNLPLDAIEQAPFFQAVTG